MSQTLSTRDRVDRGALVAGIVADVQPVLTNDALSQRTRDAFSDARTAIDDIVGSQEQLDRDLDELERNRDLVPRQGLERLRREAHAAASDAMSEADGRWDRATTQLKESLLDDAIPTYSRERESLARQELALAIGEAKGTAARQRAMHLVEAGSREATAVLLRDPFGQTLLEARGVSGRELHEFMRVARTIAASLAPDNGATERERAAGVALQQLGGFGAARGAAGILRTR